jgi:hypothetical protein
MNLVFVSQERRRNKKERHLRIEIFTGLVDRKFSGVMSSRNTQHKSCKGVLKEFQQAASNWYSHFKHFQSCDTVPLKLLPDSSDHLRHVVLIRQLVIRSGTRPIISYLVNVKFLLYTIFRTVSPGPQLLRTLYRKPVTHAK